MAIPAGYPGFLGVSTGHFWPQDQTSRGPQPSVYGMKVRYKKYVPIFPCTDLVKIKLDN